MFGTHALSLTSGFEKAYGNIIRRYVTYRPKQTFNFYPRFPDQKPPEIVPSKVFMVQLNGGLKGRPWWDRKRLYQIGLNPEVDKRGIVLLKNNEEMCRLLWRVKHLVKITPVTFPNGEPTKEDIGATYLNSQGQLLVSKKYETDPAALQANTEFWNSETGLDRKTKKKDSLSRWLRGWDLD